MDQSDQTHDNANDAEKDDQNPGKKDHTDEGMAPDGQASQDSDEAIQEQLASANASAGGEDLENGNDATDQPVDADEL